MSGRVQQKSIVKFVTVIFVLTVLSAVLFFSSCGHAAADGMDISYIDDVFQQSSSYDSAVMSYIQSSYNQYVCFEDENYFYACFYPCSNFYSTFGYVSMYYIEFDYNYRDNWYIYRQDASFSESLLNHAYNSNKFGIGCFARFSKQDNSLFIFETRCNSLYNSSSENLQTYSAGDTNLSNPISLGSPFYYYTRYDRVSGFDKNVLVGTWSSMSTIHFDHVYNRFASTSDCGCVNPSYVFRFQFTNPAPSGPSYTDDDRLKFSTSLRGDGEKLLNTDLSDFLHWGPAAYQDISDLVLTLDCDGTEVSVSLDDTNSEIVNIKNPNYSRTCVYITPYSAY